MNSFKIVLLCLSILTVSCKNNSDGKIETEVSSVAQEHAHGDEEIQLNQGQKWKVDAEMLSIIRAMENDVASFKGSELAEYISLSEKLKNNIDLLTSNCTMKGQAHDELHKWLLPYIDLVNAFSEAKNGADTEKLFQDVKNSFVTFNQYFQ